MFHTYVWKANYICALTVSKVFPISTVFPQQRNFTFLLELRRMKNTQRNWIQPWVGVWKRVCRQQGSRFGPRLPKYARKQNSLRRLEPGCRRYLNENRSKVRFVWIFASFKECWCQGRLLCAYLKLVSPLSVRLVIASLADFPHKSSGKKSKRHVR